jgi:spore coat polysaccharide biosynthesis protein SpsF
MPFFYEQPQCFRIHLLNHSPDYGSLRWTVDTPEDLELVRLIYSRYSNRDRFSWLEVLELFQREPELSAINAQVRHKDYRAVDSRTPDKHRST